MFPRLASLSGVAFPRWTDYSGGLTPADKTVLYANENLFLSLFFSRHDFSFSPIFGRSRTGDRLPFIPLFFYRLLLLLRELRMQGLYGTHEDRELNL